MSYMYTQVFNVLALLSHQHNVKLSHGKIINSHLILLYINVFDDKYNNHILNKSNCYLFNLSLQAMKILSSVQLYFNNQRENLCFIFSEPIFRRGK